MRISGWRHLATMAERKEWIDRRGPVGSVLHVYDDFYAYTNGVYRHVTGASAGYHCVEVIGYSDAEQCWIIKNSWGPGWGEQGFGRIGYGECGIDDTSDDTDGGQVNRFPFWGVEDVLLPARPASWSGWEDLGGVLTSGPAAASWAEDRLDVFVKGTDNAVWHLWWDGAWNGWESLGGTIDDSPAAVSRGDGRVDVFGRGTDNHLWHLCFDGSGWSGWEDLGGVLTSGPAAASWAEDRLDVFVKGTDNAVWHLWWDGAWNGWESLGGTINHTPAAVSWGRDRIDVFGCGTDNHTWHRWYRSLT